VDRRRAVAWATAISIALVLGSGLVALGAGAFAEPPVDHVGSFESINAQFAPSSTADPADAADSGAAPRASHPDTSQPRGSAPVDPSTTSGAPATPPTPVPTDGPSSGSEVEQHGRTTVRAGTSTSSADDDHEPPVRERSEHEQPDD
jgi:hypothetical protein